MFYKFGQQTIRTRPLIIDPINAHSGTVSDVTMLVRNSKRERETDRQADRVGV